VESLEGRVVLSGIAQADLPDLAMTGVTSLSPQQVSAAYEITGDMLTPMTLGIYRSATSSLDGSSVLVGQTTLQASELTPGAHQVVVSLAQPLDINPSLKDVLAVADPAGQVAETTKADNSASFRIWVVGAVVHGAQLDGQFPSWVTSMTTALQADGYDAAIPFNWAAASSFRDGGVVSAEGFLLRDAVDQAAVGLPTQPNDVVDVHLIGFSRGASVVTEAASLLDRSTAPLSGGYLKLTLLDPHAATNLGVPEFSSSSGPIGTLARLNYQAFQVSHDPPPTIPAGVNSTEVFYQQAPVTTALLPTEKFLNLWGAVPVAGSTAGVTYYNLTGIVNSHEGVHFFYQQQVVPLLASGTAVPLPPSPTPSPPTHGGPIPANPRLGLRYEYRLARSVGVRPSASIYVLRNFAVLNRMLLNTQVPPQLAVEGLQIHKLGGFINRQAGRSVPVLVATYLDELLAETLESLATRSPAP
jgi:hypothetical protein